jgi:hypothetical protein
VTDRTDDFNRANGGLGANWTAIADANHATLAIATNKVVVGTNNTDCASIWSADTFQNDQYSEATYTVGTSASNQGCIVRGRTSPNIRYYDFLLGSGGAFLDAIEYYDGTTWNGLATAAGSGSGTVRCEVTGTSIVGKFNGTTVLTVTDATLSSGAPGLHLYDGVSDATMDDWLGGPITATTQPTDYYSMRSVAEARRGSAQPHLLPYDATPFVRQVAFRQRAHGGGGGSATRAVSFGAGVTAGSIIIVAGMFDSATTSVTISDDKGDTPTTVIATKLSGDGGAKYYCSAFLAPTTGAITVTATYSGATPTFDCLFIWEGVGLTNPVADKFPDAQGTGTAADSGSTGTLSAAVELAIAFGITADVFTTGGTGWTNVNIDASTGSIGEERVIAATTAINGTGTTSLSAAWDILCATFMSGTSGVPSGSSDYYVTRSIMEGIITSANPHLLQYDGFAPSPKVKAQGDAGYYNVEVVPPTKAGRPAFESYPPRGNVPSPVVPYGKTDYFDSRLFSQTLRGAKPQWQQHDSYALRFVQQLAPPGAGGPVWFYDARLQLVARAGKPNIFTFPFDGFQPLGSIAVVAQVYGADSYYQWDVYPKLRFRDQHDAHAPRGLVPTAATPQGWTAYFDEDHPPKFKSSLHPVDQDQTPDLPPFAATQGWTATFDSRAVKARPVREYEATGITFTAAATVVTGATDYQSLDLFQPFRSARFPHEAVYPAMGLVPTAATPQGWWTPLDVARVRPFGAQLQQHDGYQHFFPPVAVNLGPLGWSMYWDRGRKPLLPDRLPFLFEQLYQTPTTFVPNGWTSPLLDTARVKVFRASLQQYDALQRLSFVPPFIVPPGDWYDVRIIRPRPRDYQVVDRPMFFPPPFPFDWVDARVIRPRAVSYSVVDQQPAVVVPPSAYVLFPDLFKRPRPFPYLLWPEQRVAVLNTPAGTGGPTHYFDRRLAVFHRPVVDVLTYDHRGLPFVVVNLIIQKPGPAGLLSGVSLSATKAQDTLAGLKGGTGLQGEVEG